MRAHRGLKLQHKSLSLSSLSSLAHRGFEPQRKCTIGHVTHAVVVLADARQPKVGVDGQVGVHRGAKARGGELGPMGRLGHIALA